MLVATLKILNYACLPQKVNDPLLFSLSLSYSPSLSLSPSLSSSLPLSFSLPPSLNLSPSPFPPPLPTYAVVIGFVQPSTTVPETGNAMVFVAVLDGTIPPGEEYIVTLTTADDTATGTWSTDTQLCIFSHNVSLHVY